MLETANAMVLLFPTALGAAYIGYGQHLNSTLVGLTVGLVNLVVAFVAVSNVPDHPDIAGWIILCVFVAQFVGGVAVGAFLKDRSTAKANLTGSTHG